MGSSVASVVRVRAGALRRWHAGEPATQVAAALGIGRATLYRWQERYGVRGLQGLIDGPKLGRASELDPVLERVIITVRLLTNWNSRRIAAEFGRRDVHVGPGQVDRLLARYGTHRSSTPRIPGPRYERSVPNELWHIDLKGPFYLHPAAGPIRTCHFVALVDDHSRYLLGIRAIPSKEALAILDVLGEAIELCGIPLALMTDNGTPFVAIARSMMSRFGRTLAELEIRHIRTQVDTPWTNGKVEAFWARQPWSGWVPPGTAPSAPAAPKLDSTSTVTAAPATRDPARITDLLVDAPSTLRRRHRTLDPGRCTVPAGLIRARYRCASVGRARADGAGRIVVSRCRCVVP